MSTNIAAEIEAEKAYPETPPIAHGFVFTHMYQREGFIKGFKAAQELSDIEKTTALVQELRGSVMELAIYAMRASDALWNTQNMNAAPPLPSENIQDIAGDGDALYRKYVTYIDATTNNTTQP